MTQKEFFHCLKNNNKLFKFCESSGGDCLMDSNFLFKKLFNSGNSLQIEFRDHSKQKKLFKTVIEKMGDREVTLILPVSQQIPPGTKLVVIGRHDADLKNYYFTAEILAFHQGDPATITISMPVTMQTTSRRRFFRCDVDLFFIYQDDTETEYRGRIVNLSASGLFAIVKDNPSLKLHQIITCQLHLPTSVEPIRFEGKVIRVESTENDDEKGIALDFVNISEKIKNEITKYLFQRQRELIKMGHIKAGRI